ncbi:protease adaptor protein RcdA [Labrys wisconsinensis]|uniref:Regulator of CtrA degradation n=1 Tax=Labrys wisconsinensis TaxID=425677 RepID=A0ABU0JA56_9HYPH|nr:DUF1465 family protein [Labrys wisconsinensis]MDQ0471139.1 regulator of CtrA degradation [Labrys wisconsinensis]
MTESLGKHPAEMVLLSERLLSSSAFKVLFREGMALVESTAAYLDGPGRAESRELDRAAALAYATESMRLTTRLMQLASWLLLQRAVNEGEMTQDQARTEKNRVRLASAAPDPGAEVLGLLPPTLVQLIRHSLRLQQRLARLEEVLSNPEAPVPEQDNAVGQQIDLIRQAFGGR